jgi:release factor glutamine methyltransferase
MNAIDKLKKVSVFFEAQGIEDAAKEAEMLITEALHISKSVFYSGDMEISDETSRHIDSLAARRAEGEPIQYIIGHVDFYGLKINVGKGVLIPRPETELLVEETIKQLKKRFTVHGSRFTVLDLCTGSGCIAITIAKHFPDADVYGVDKSGTAIQCATRNAAENNVRNVHFIKGNLFEPVGKMAFDCIVSNPPYIKTDDIQNLQREIKDYEPVEALDGGEDGLNFYRMIFKNAPKFLKENGIIILEIGHDQADDMGKIAMNAGFKNVTFIKDYAGIKRILVGSFK